MKKKFDFTAEMKEAQITKSTPQNEYLEEEKRLLGINVKELAYSGAYPFTFWQHIKA